MIKLIRLVLAITFCVDYSENLEYPILNEDREKDSSYWYSLSRNELDSALNRKIQENIAKNIIIFVGDGLGITTTTAGRIFKGQKNGVSGEEQFLKWEKFPNAAFIKTYCLDKQVSDSSSTATAIFGGTKTNFQTVGVNGKVRKGDCKASLIPSNRVKSILEWSQDSGKDTGIVTTTRITHATPSALYAHSAHRDWECDSKMKNQSEFEVGGCKDIALQLIEESPGRDVNVILGGGRNSLGAGLSNDNKDGCIRNDSRNLALEWLKDKSKMHDKIAKYVTNDEELDEIDPKSVDYLMGLFAGSHLPYAYERENNDTGVPSLKRLTEVAIKRLNRNDKGFFLMVEGGRIDHGLHDSKAHAAFLELLEFEEAVEVALKMTSIEDTLIIVTADHSHVMTINGYPSRGHDILGITTSETVSDKMPYTTLMFTTGFGANYSWNGEKVVRPNLTDTDTRDFDFVFPSAVPTSSGGETHGGEDIGVYAIGPMSHLFHNVHEQSYIAHVMAYSSCVGPYEDDCKRPRDERTSSAQRKVSNRILMFINLLLFLNVISKIY